MILTIYLLITLIIFVGAVILWGEEIDKSPNKLLSGVMLVVASLFWPGSLVLFVVIHQILRRGF